MDKFYTVQEVARLFKVHPKTITNYIEQGKLKALKFGNRWRIKSDEVTRFIDGKEEMQ